MAQRILVTGAAGFIGSHVAQALLARGDEVVGVDNLNDYYDPALKRARLERIDSERFQFAKLDVADRSAMETLFAEQRFDAVVHLAAQAGVRYSLVNPHAYVQGNVVGFLHILEGCRHQAVRHLVYASSSSVYGANTKMPFSVRDSVDHPLSLYAATKKANELMAHTYSHLYGLATTGLRFFTVYGPWGRPDMALFKFTHAILHGEPIDVFNHGKMRRDFTYIDDIVVGVVRVLDRLPSPTRGEGAVNAGRAAAPYRVYNIGNHAPVELMYLISLLEKAIGKPAEKRFLPMQSGDVPATFAEVADLEADTGFAPATPIEAGVERFVGWYREFHRV